MRVLIGCERSGVVRDAFAELGHDALSCDLAPCTRGGPHYRGDVRDLFGEPFDLFIVHPPCTYVSSSGLHWNRRGRLVDGRPRAELTAEAVEFAAAMLAAPFPLVAMENPIGCLSTMIRKPDQIVQPYRFGHDASKSTCLWLRGLPLLVPTAYVFPRIVNGLPRWANQTDSGQSNLSPSARRGEIRSVTYSGIASAMARQWGSVQTAPGGPRHLTPVQNAYR